MFEPRVVESMTPRTRLLLVMLCVALPVSGLYAYRVSHQAPPIKEVVEQVAKTTPPAAPITANSDDDFAPRGAFDPSGFLLTIPTQQWPQDASLTEIRDHWEKWHQEMARSLKQAQVDAGNDPSELMSALAIRASFFLSEGKADEASALLREARQVIERIGGQARYSLLGSLIYFQGVASLRQGENDNCIMCRGDSSCIVPIRDTAIHKNPNGSRQAIVHFSEYLEHYPDDLSVRWLLNLAHMTLGEYPEGVDPRYLLKLQPFLHPEHDIGRFRDVGHLVGVNRFNQAGGVIMDDFDDDGLFDLFVTSMDVKQQSDLYRNNGQGKFDLSTEASGIEGQLGGLNCAQADFNNDGRLDVFIVRGAWISGPMRPTLLRNDGNLKFTDVTEETGLLVPVNSNSAQWGDYNNDGLVDLIVCCERQRHLLFRNLGNGRFEECASAAKLTSDGQSFGKGSSWIDYDNDGYLDLFINYLSGRGQLYHNQQDGTFANATTLLDDGGTPNGFSCWCWDFNNDGWQDIFSTCYRRSMKEVVRGLEGQPHDMPSNSLYLNLGGKGFRNIVKESGLDLSFATMGSNFADFNNDGLLDFYLGTGEPDIGTLVPNRMFLNVDGEHFSEITTSAGVGHLQKGHGVACGDWNRDGHTDIFLQIGGAVDGDKFHNAMFQNPGLGGGWFSVKLTGDKTNRSAIGARIKAIVSGPSGQQEIHRHVSSGSSFGANPLEQPFGVGDATRVERLEIFWPTSQFTQVFEDVPLGHVLHITEFAKDYKAVAPQPIPLPTK